MSYVIGVCHFLRVSKKNVPEKTSARLPEVCSSLNVANLVPSKYTVVPMEEYVLVFFRYLAANSKIRSWRCITLESPFDLSSVNAALILVIHIAFFLNLSRVSQSSAALFSAARIAISDS